MLIVYPVKTSLLICYIAGALLLFGGVVALIRYIASRGEPFFFRYDLFVALVLILFGCFVIFESDLVIAFIPVVIGIILLANGLLSIQKAFNLKKTGLEKWWLEFLLALLTSVLGIIICTNPFDAVATTNIFIGILPCLQRHFRSCHHLLHGPRKTPDQKRHPDRDQPAENPAR